MKKTKMCVLIIAVFMILPNAYAGKEELAAGYSAQYGEYVNLKSTQDSYFATTSGNVGIGLVKPSAALHVKSRGSTQVLIEGATSSGEAHTTPYDASLVLRRNYNNSSFPVTLSTDASMGGVGSSSLKINTSYYSSSGVQSAPRMYIDGYYGYVGIGTTKPSYALDVNGSCNSGAWCGALRLKSGESTQVLIEGASSSNKTPYDAALVLVRNYNKSAYPVTLKTSSGITGNEAGSLMINTTYWDGSAITEATRMFIDGYGYVGIGTTTPSYKLDINGTAGCTSGVWAGSDLRWKKNIEPLKDSLSKVMRLSGVNYEWKIAEFPQKGFTEGLQVGLIAQDVEKVIPELVMTDREGYKSISYEKIAPLLIESIKEQENKIEMLKKTIRDQQQEFEKQQQRSDFLEREITELKKEVGRFSGTRAGDKP